MKRFYLSKLAILLVALAGWNISAFAQTTSFGYISGVIQTYTVPAGITSLAIDMAGANGGSSYFSGYGVAGLGGRVQCVLNVSPGQVLDIVVGSVGLNGGSSCCTSPSGGGYNGGGGGVGYGGAGGGGSDIRIGGTTISMRVVVAGGGGGCGSEDGTCSGGNGGGLNAAGGYSGGTAYPSCYSGGGGTQSAGGLSPTCYSGFNGAFWAGTNGGYDYCAGGGGGWYGGGGGDYYGGGGGGSSYTSPTLVPTTSVTHTPGYNVAASGNGYVNICPGPIMGTIAGGLSACPGTTTTLSDGTSSVPGTWSTGSTNISIGATSGVVTGIAAGVGVVTYTASNSCASGTLTASVVVNPTPPVPTGPVNLCPGTNITLTDATSGGTWSTSSALIATIGSSSGIATGVNAGIPTITYTAPTSCIVTAVVFAVNPAPPSHNVTVTGGGLFCPGSTGVHIGLNGTDYGINYQLYYGSTAELPILPGSGPSIDFGTWSGIGTYTVLATNAGSGCTSPMSGSAIVNTYPAIPINNVTGGGPYCAGTGGVAIGLNGSATGVNYQLYNGLGADGPYVSGTGIAITFGTRTTSGTRTVVATNPLTGCTANMAGSTIVTINPLPLTHNLTEPDGSATFCAGGTGVHIGLNGSDVGVTYHLLNGTTPMGSTAGTASPLTFGPETIPGNYTITGSFSTGCTTIMDGAAEVDTIPLPAIYPVTGGGGYCSGSGIGVAVGLGYSATGVNYQLYNISGPVGTTYSGNDSALYFGVLPAGVYHVVATSGSSTCTNMMSGMATVTMNLPPANETLSGGGSYCPGTSGVPLILSGSVLGTNYQLFNGSVPVGTAMAGTGVPLTFSSITDSGAYSVIATVGSTGCSINMAGNPAVSPYTPPTVYNVTGGGGYCFDGAGMPVGLSSSDGGVRYQLFIGGTPLTTMTGISGALSFGNRTTAGDYTIVATDITNGCTSNMSGDAAITVNPLPSVYTVMGGGGYCAGGAGSDIYLGYSSVGVSYQLYSGGSTVGSAIGGTGDTLDLGVQPAIGTYSVVATNMSTYCMSNMTGAATVSINALPNTYPVTGGGSFCQGGSGEPVGLMTSSLGIHYQLYNGMLPVGGVITGTGTALSFGLQTVPATYTVNAVDPSTSCANAMTGGAPVTVNPAPPAHTVTGGGSYCAGTGTGVNVGLDSTDVGISYTLYYDGASMGSWPGTGTALVFGSETGVGTYIVSAENTSTTCTGNMSGAVTVATLPAPVAYTVTGGGTYCAGGTGTHVYLSSSTSGVNYYLNNGGVIETMAGTGSALDFGSQTMSGVFSVTATNATTGCNGNMASSAMITVNPLPDTFSVMPGGSYCAGGTGVPVTLAGSNTGISYVLYNGTSEVQTVSGSGSSIPFGSKTAPGTYTVVAVNTLTGCSNTMNSSAVVTVIPTVTPSVTVLSSIPTTVCAGTMGTYTATVVNGGTGTTYQWFVSGGSTSGTGSAYSFTPGDAQTVYVQITSDAPCASPATVTSTPVTMTVIANQTPAVSLAASAINVCQGSDVFFTASPSNGGTMATYSWILDNSIIGMGSTLAYDAIPHNGDTVFVVMASNYPCIIGSDSAMSSRIGISVAPPLNPYVTVTANPSNDIKMNTNVTFTAHATGAGNAAAYQWSVNGNEVAGANDSTFSGNQFNDGDNVFCSVTAGNICGTNTGNSNHVIMSVENTTGIQAITSSGSDIKLLPNPNKGDFTIKGSFSTSSQQAVGIIITNMLGEVVYKENVTVQDGKINEHIQLSNNLAGGVYMLNLNSSDGNTVFHFVVE